MQILTDIRKSFQWRSTALTRHLFSRLPLFAKKWFFRQAVYHPFMVRHRSNSLHTLTDIYLELRTFCNNTCPFCIASRDPRPDQSMPYELYEKIIQDLVDMQFDGTIHYYQTNDPLVVRDFPRFLAHAKQRLPNVRHYVLTNGLALNVKNGRAILEAGCSVLSINVYSDSPVLVIPKNVQRFLDEVLFQIYPRESQSVPIQETKDSFVFKTQDFSLYIRRRWMNTILTPRVGTAPNNPVVAKGETFLGFCEMPFTQMTVTADGRVGRCCNDALIPMPMGNARDQTLQEIWNGASYERLRGELLRNNRHADEFCRKCTSLGLHSWRPHTTMQRFCKEWSDQWNPQPEATEDP
ncbi:MAG: radical SAM/SPASM domain-containing protein [Magnetococcales bacterium]|nr:radical SAM/SPASM domain-containing protein [Magnetococcales bacterium]